MVAATKPAWLEGLMSETFFSSCGIHGSRRKSEKNVFCLLCCLGVCPHCLPSHRSHPLLQVKIYQIIYRMFTNYSFIGIEIDQLRIDYLCEISLVFVCFFVNFVWSVVITSENNGWPMTWFRHDFNTQVSDFFLSCDCFIIIKSIRTCTKQEPLCIRMLFCWFLKDNSISLTWEFLDWSKTCTYYIL